MHKTSFITAVTVFFVLSVQSACAQSTPAPNMSFFITSAGPGNGADLGGISGADAHCQSLAAAVGAGNRTWRAYLSTVGQGGVNARDRIGSGPWFNFAGGQIAASVADLHTDNVNLIAQTVLNETGGLI